MEYRRLGRTEQKVSAIGLGCEHLDGKPFAQVEETIRAALEGGVNIMDVFMPGTEVRENIQKALGKQRGHVQIQGHIGSTNINQQYDISRDPAVIRRAFEELLRLFGYIDYGMLFFIDTPKDYADVFETDFINYARQLKDKGDIRYIGFSSHNPETAMRVIETGLVDMMMFSVNPAFDMLPSAAYVFDHIETGFGADLFRGMDPTRALLYKLCAKNDIGMTAMKTLGAGKLLSREHTPYAEPLTAAQCVHYALSRPAVASVLPGCQTADEMRDMLTYFSLSDKEKDFSRVISGVRNDFMGQCVYCGHCGPCPENIDIAAVNRYLDIALLNEQRIPPSIRAHYHHLQARGKDCTQCGQCETRCPFDVPVIEKMQQAECLIL